MTTSFKPEASTRLNPIPAKYQHKIRLAKCGYCGLPTEALKQKNVCASHLKCKMDWERDHAEKV